MVGRVRKSIQAAQGVLVQSTTFEPNCSRGIPISILSCFPNNSKCDFDLRRGRHLEAGLLY